MEEEEDDDDKAEDEDEEEEELMLLAVVKGVMEGVAVSPATYFLCDPLLRAPTFHPRTDASSTSVTRRPCRTGSLGWRAAKWAAILYNQPVVVHWGQFTGRWVQGLALVAVDIRAQEIGDGCDGQELTATTMRFHVGQDCNGKRIVHSSRAPQNRKYWGMTGPPVLQCGDHVNTYAC